MLLNNIKVQKLREQKTARDKIQTMYTLLTQSVWKELAAEILPHVPPKATKGYQWLP